MNRTFVPHLARLVSFGHRLARGSTLLGFSLLCLTTACDSGGTTPPGDTPVSSDAATVQPNGSSDELPGGETPSDCNFRVEGKCYADQASACTAAGCPSDCLVLESYPAQIQCPNG
jgi:hypothetical protein